MADLETLMRGITARLRPSPRTDGTRDGETVRLGRYGDQFQLPLGSSRHNLAEEGSYFVATNPTPSTGVAYGSGGTQATFADTAGFFTFKNNAPAGSGIQMFLDYIRLIVGGTVPASATSTQFAVKLDPTNRAPTANASVIAGVNVNLGLANAPNGQLWVPSAGIPTLPAAGAGARLISRGTIRYAISVVLDEYMLRFGTDDPGPIVATAVGRYVATAPPVVLDPQQFALVHLWQPSGATNPLTVEFETGWWER